MRGDEPDKLGMTTREGRFTLRTACGLIQACM